MTDSNMTNLLLSETLGQPGVYGLLQEIINRQVIEIDDIYAISHKHGIEERSTIIENLKEINIIFESDKKVYPSNKGQQMWLLLNAINGADLKETFNRLRHLDPTLFPYEIVTEGMTAEFIDSLSKIPIFRRVLICSPWVYIKRKVLQKFTYAIFKAQEKNPSNKVDVIIITRPLIKKDPNYQNFLTMFQNLTRIGVEILLHDKLHSKLYIRDPGMIGGYSQAIFGSENLTSKRNIELGIRITNDTIILNKLINYFFELYSQCKPFLEE